MVLVVAVVLVVVKVVKVVFGDLVITMMAMGMVLIH